MTILKKYFFVLISAVILFGNIGLVFAIGDYGISDTVSKTNLPHNTDSNQVPALAGQLIGQVLAFIGVIFFGLVVYGGFKWMTAQGNAKQAEEGRDIIVRATIGLIIIFSAYAITSFVGGVAQNPGT